MSSSPCPWSTARVATRATRELAGSAGSVKLYESVPGEGGAKSASSVNTGQAKTVPAADAGMGNSFVDYGHSMRRRRSDSGGLSP
ncbi:hypothetical protein [Streptomyces sp. NPDC005009]